MASLLFAPKPFSVANTRRCYSTPLRSSLALSSLPPRSISASASASMPDAAYGGWDAVSIGDEKNPLDALLYGVGVSGDAGKYGSLFVLGFVSAFAVSRVSISPLLLLPISAVAFAFGIAVGDGNSKGMIRPVRHLDAKFGSLRSIFGELDGKMDILASGLLKIAASEMPCATEVRELAKVAKGVNGGVANAAGIIEELEVELCGCESERLSLKEPPLKSLGSGIILYLSGLVKDTLGELTLNTPRKKGGKEKPVKEESTVMDYRHGEDAGTGKSLEGVKGFRIDSPLRPEEKVECNAVDKSLGKQLDDNKSSLRDKKTILGMASYDEDMSDLTGRKPLARKRDSTISNKIYEKRPTNEFFEQLEDSDSKRHLRGSANTMRFFSESHESSLLERTVKIRDRSLKLKVEKAGEGIFSESDVKENVVEENEFASLNISEASNIASSTKLDDEEFHHNMAKGSELLRKARENMLNRADEEVVDTLLNASARLLSAAVSLRPLSLLAVGQLGNTYLLHGELKLKVSRELRILLSHDESYLSRKERQLRVKNLDEKIPSRENIASALVCVCEECEHLLVEAGRNYRTALSIDGSDVKALYNWGLALSFRAELIADIGPDAAIDADKVYLAAIDKFDALLARSNAYAPEALYRWGFVLHQRSQLRPWNSKQKTRLLEQAKCMFEDALRVETDNPVVREALSSCISELSHHGRWS